MKIFTHIYIHKYIYFFIYIHIHVKEVVFCYKNTLIGYCGRPNQDPGKSSEGEHETVYKAEKGLKEPSTYLGLSWPNVQTYK